MPVVSRQNLWLQEQVDSRDRTSGCWEWPFRRRPTGYGIALLKRSYGSAHALALMFDGQPRPAAPNDYALHSCDNPPCVNPAHLRWGSQKDNIREMDAKGRRRVNPQKGEEVATAKLTEAQARYIRAAYVPGQGGNGAALSQEFGVSRSTICRIGNGRHWRHLQNQARGMRGDAA